MSLTLVTIPVHNEASRIENTLNTIDREIRSKLPNSRIAVVEDGSTDGTPELLNGAKERFPWLIVKTDSTKRGRGYAISKLWKETPADVYAFLDADLSAGPTALLQAVAFVEGGFDVAVGSRYCSGAIVNRPPTRRIASVGYNWLVRNSFGDGVMDHQCGLKAFKGDAVQQLLSVCNEPSCVP